MKPRAALLLLAFAALAAPPDPNMLAAEDFIQKGEYRKALEALELTVRLAPKRDPEVYVMMGVARLNLGDKIGAVDACEEGMRAFPDSARIEDYYAALLPQVVPAAAVHQRLEAAIQRSKRPGNLQKALGKALLDARSDDPKTARTLDAARRALPRDPEAHYLYGRWACLHQQEAVCVEALGRSLALTPAGNTAATLLVNGMLGVAHDRLGHPREAAEAFQRALAAYRKAEKPAPDVPYQFVRFLLGRSETARAKRVNGEILARNPDFAPSHLEQAQFLFREQKTAQAVEEANLALRLSPPDKVQLRSIHAFLVKAYAALGNETDAAVHQKWVEENQ